MIPNMHIHEQLMFEYVLKMQHEAEQEQPDQQAVCNFAQVRMPIERILW